MTDHPRSRGVYAAVTPASSSPSGSSPLARGLRRRRPSPARPDRIIPARAGFTAACSPRDAVRRDHPRSRGVYGPVQAHQGVGDGSSPLARGLRAEVGRLRAADRIIPARAGFTSGRLPQEAAGQDHPRSRGVYHQRPRHRHAPLGSSPLARGLPVERERARASLRIIPARAGFTPAPTATPPQDEDHPRSRGVYRSPDLTADTKDGSSPLARGLRHSEPVLISRSGIIPARAGFTSRRFCSTGSVWDHPRSRGVYSARS